MYFDYTILQLIQSNKINLYKKIQKFHIKYKKMLQINSNCSQNDWTKHKIESKQSFHR